MREPFAWILYRLPWVLLGAFLSWNTHPHDRKCVSTARHLAELHNEPGVSTQLVNLLGINTSLLMEVQDDLLNRWAASKRQTAAWVHTGPLKRYYRSPAQDIFVRLHQLLFHLELLPLSTWGGRDDFSEPRPAWLKHAASVGRKRTVGTLSRLGLNSFLLQHEHRVPANSTCLGVDVATQYLPIFSGCNRKQLWSLRYEPDDPAAPRPPRLNWKRRWLHLDLMSVRSEGLAGQAHELFDLTVIQETFEHIRFPYQAAAALYYLLRPGGMVLWTAPFSTRFHLIPGDYFRYTFDGARVIFADAGFQIAGLAKFGDTAMASGYNLGFGSADFTAAHLRDRLVQEVTQPEGKAVWACSEAEALYISSAVVAVKPHNGRRAKRLPSALKMGRG